MSRNHRSRLAKILLTTSALLLVPAGAASAQGPDPIYVCHKPFVLGTTYCVEIDWWGLTQGRGPI